MIDAFNRYDEANPRVWQLFKRFAFEAIEASRTRLSASLIAERIRWEVSVATFGEPFKINNNYRAFYARKFEEHFPQHAGKFAFRQSVADGA